MGYSSSEFSDSVVWLHSLNGFQHDKTIVLLLAVVVSPLDLTVSVLACLGEREGEFSEGGTEGRTSKGSGGIEGRTSQGTGFAMDWYLIQIT